MPDDAYNEIDLFVRNRFYSDMATLRDDRDKQRLAVSADLAARGYGVALNPLDTHFDDLEVAHCNAVLRAKAAALFEVYGRSPDEHLLQQLHRQHSDLVAGRKNSLKGEAGMRALRRGENASTNVARAEAVGRKIERSTHATMKALICEVEKRKHMRTTETGQHITFEQNVYAPADSVAQGHSVTVAVHKTDSIFNSIATTITDNVQDSREKAALLASVGSVKEAKDKPTFLQRTSSLINLANGCVQLAHHVPSWFDALRQHADQLFK